MGSWADSDDFSTTSRRRAFVKPIDEIPIDAKVATRILKMVKPVTWDCTPKYSICLSQEAMASTMLVSTQVAFS